MPGDQVCNRDTLLLALAREHWTAYAIAHRPYPVHSRAALVINLDEPALIQFHTGAGVQQAVCERSATNGNNDLVESYRLRALRVGVSDVDGVALNLGTRHLRAETNIEPLLFELSLRFFCNLLINNRQEVRQRF